MKEKKKKKGMKKQRYTPPELKKFTIDELSMDWSLEAIGIPTSCSTSCL